MLGRVRPRARVSLVASIELCLPVPSHPGNGLSARQNVVDHVERDGLNAAVPCSQERCERTGIPLHPAEPDGGIPIISGAVP